METLLMEKQAVQLATLKDRLRHFTPALATLSHTLFDAQVQGHIQAEGLRLYALPVETRHWRKPVKLRLGMLPGEIDVVFDVADYPSLSIIATSHNAAMRAALANLLLSPLLKSLGGFLHMPVDVLAMDMVTAPSAKEGLHLYVQHRVENERTRQAAIIVADVQFRQASPFAGLTGDITHLPDYMARLSVPGRVRIGQRYCSPSVLRSLRPGDVLMNGLFIEPDLPITPGQLVLSPVTLQWGMPHCQQLQATGRLEGHRFTIEEIDIMHTEDNAAFSATGDHGAEQVAVEHIELPINLEIDTIALSVSRLSTLGRGQVIELPVSVDDTQVRLVSYGQTLGLGQLVVVGDRLGVQIISMGGGHESNA